MTDPNVWSGRAMQGDFRMCCRVQRFPHALGGRRHVDMFDAPLHLIHPGRAIRIGQACDRGTALSALAAVELIARDLKP
jgi:hypothetical protein